MEAAGAKRLGWHDLVLELNAASARRMRMQELAARALLQGATRPRRMNRIDASGQAMSRAVGLVAAVGLAVADVAVDGW